MTIDENVEGEASGFASAIATVLSEFGTYRSTTFGATTVYENGAKFAELVELRKWADVSFTLSEPVDHSRVRGLTLDLPGGWSHTVRLYTVEDVDHELAQWLRGAHEHADNGVIKQEISPLTDDQLERFSAAFGSPVVQIDRELAVPVPNVLRLAMGQRSSVVVAVSGIEYETDMFVVDDDAYIPVDDVTGLGEGRSTEVTLRAKF